MQRKVRGDALVDVSPHSNASCAGLRQTMSWYIKKMHVQFSNDELVHITVKPLDKGQFWTSHFVYCRETTYFTKDKRMYYQTNQVHFGKCRCPSHSD